MECGGSKVIRFLIYFEGFIDVRMGGCEKTGDKYDCKILVLVIGRMELLFFEIDEKGGGIFFLRCFLDII